VELPVRGFIASKLRLMGVGDVVTADEGVDEVVPEE
jgi:hypothetical protein